MGSRGINRYSTDSQDSDNTLFDTIVIVHYTCIQAYRRDTTKSEPQCEQCTLSGYDVSMSVHQLQVHPFEGGTWKMRAMYV